MITCWCKVCFNIRFHAGLHPEWAFRRRLSCRHEWCPASHIKRDDGFVFVRRKSRREFRDGIPHARRFRGYEPSTEAPPTWFLLSDPPIISGWSPFALLRTLRLPRPSRITLTTHKARVGIVSEEIYIPTLDIPGRLSRKIWGRAYALFSRDIFFSSPRENKHANVACVAFFLN